MIRLVATDLDGTLLRVDGTLSPRTGSALRAADDAGLDVVIVTARPLRWMNDLWEMVGSHGVAIVSNGAAVYDVSKHRVVETQAIPVADGLELVERIVAVVPSAAFAVECVGGIRLGTGFDEPERTPTGTPRGPLSQVWAEPALKLMVRAPLVEAPALQERVERAVAGRAIATWSVPGLVEISAIGVTKASVLQRLCAVRGITASQVAAFGDMPNDLPMLTWAGTSYAVANAHPSVVAAADRVTASNQDDGVARVIETFVRERTG